MSKAAASKTGITRTDASALWHAVQNFGFMVRAMNDMPDLTPEQRDAEKARHKAARQALRKVQALVRASKGAKA